MRLHRERKNLDINSKYSTKSFSSVVTELSCLSMLPVDVASTAKKGEPRFALS